MLPGIHKSKKPPDESHPFDRSVKELEGFTGRFFKSILGVFGDVYLILCIAFFTVLPGIYVRGIAKLIPKNSRLKGGGDFKKARPKVEQVVERIIILNVDSV